MAPVLVLICVCAHSPKALEAPDLLTRATTIPRNTRNKNIPALSETDVERPLMATLSTVPRNEH